MSVVIYYFSGTGNSLVVAKELAQKLGAEVVSIPKIMDIERIQIDADSIGIVFPSYLAALSGVPLMVEQFVRKIANIESLCIFAVCTCGGYECVNALPPLKRLRQVISSCGGKLSAEFSVRLPMNNLDYDHIPVPIVRDHEVIFNKSKMKIADICERILQKKGTKYEVGKTLFILLMTPLYKLMFKPVISSVKEKAKESLDSKLTYFELIPLTDKSICVNERCKGCGTCAKICPAKNIKLVGNKPEFQHQCEMCFACDEWCPAGAIQHWGRSEGIKYHHPEVKISDMF